MAHLLHIDASPRGDRSHSRKLSREFVEAWVAAHPGDKVTYRDLGHNPVPLVSEAWIAANYTPAEAQTPETRELLRISDELIEELMAADIYVFGMPMYNFGVAAGFKAYIDQVVRAGRTFTRPNMEGLLKGKKMYLAMAAGADYAVGLPMANYNHVLPYLRAVFGFVGVTDITPIAVATAAGGEDLANFETKASKMITELVGSTR